MAETLITTVEEGVVTLRINRPDHENRLNLDVLERMEAALRQADENETVHAVVIKGTGNTFCCGGDVTERSLEDGYAFSGDLLVDLLTHPEAVAALATRKDDA